MSERNLRICSGTKRCRYAGNDFEVDTGCAQGFNLFTSAAEDQRIATLQAHHLQSQQCVLDEQRVDLALADFLLSETLADVLHFGRRRDERENLRADQVVMQNDIG